MAKHIVVINGQFVDANNNNKPFAGVVPRDLNVADQFDTVEPEGNTATHEITSKAYTDDGYLIIESKGV